MAKQGSSRQKKLQRAGLFVGLGGSVFIALYFLAIGEKPFSVYALTGVVIFGFPFLAMVGIAWKWPMAGGILLIAAGLFWPIWRLTTMYTIASSMSLLNWLYLVAIGILPVSLPMLASGILFLLSRRYLDDKKPVDSG